MKYRSVNLLKKKIINSSAVILVVLSIIIIKSNIKVDPSFIKDKLMTVLSFIIALYAILIIISKLRKRQKKQKYINSGILTVDKMGGIEFESFLQAHYEALGYNVKLTKSSCDYGVDLIIKKDGQLTIIQAKRYGSKVGVNAIQQIVAGLRYYKASKGIVVTNNYYTKNAINLAEANEIELIDRNKLIEIMDKNNCKEVAKETINRTMQTKICPVCGKDLVKKKSAYGFFYGCTNYPKCQFTRSCD